MDWIFNNQTQDTVANALEVGDETVGFDPASGLLEVEGEELGVDSVSGVSEGVVDTLEDWEVEGDCSAWFLESGSEF